MPKINKATGASNAADLPPQPESAPAPTPAPEQVAQAALTPDAPAEPGNVAAGDMTISGDLQVIRPKPAGSRRARN